MDQNENHGNHGHEHHDDEHESDGDHAHSGNPVIAWFQHLFDPHSHGHQQAALDPNLATDRGMWALKVSLAGLLSTAIFQVFIVAISGSVALLADTIHNFSDALTAIPLGSPSGFHAALATSVLTLAMVAPKISPARSSF